MMYPAVRLRRNRKSNWIREILSETRLNPANLILPIFLMDDDDSLSKNITTLPGVFRYKISELDEVVKLANSLRIKAVALFPSICQSLKDNFASEAINANNLVCNAIKHIKDLGLDIGVISDVALDPYTVSGHDGILNDKGVVDNDMTLEVLSKQAVTLAYAGADIVAPSDMMDGRVFTIRNALDAHSFCDVNILSYSVKYSSAFYSPFRDAVNSKVQNSYLDKKSYQMSVSNSKEAIREIELDINEGADIIMIKPATTCLDIIKHASLTFDAPIFAYHVSGEYAALKFAALAGAIDWDKSMLEVLTCIKRAGALAVFTYCALEAAVLINELL